MHPGESARMTSIVEKPSRELQLNSIILLSDAMSFLPKFGPFWKEPNPRPGRIQLTDAIAELLQHNTVEAMGLVGDSFNCGEKMGYLRAFVTYGLRHPSQGKPLGLGLSNCRCKVARFDRIVHPAF